MCYILKKVKEGISMGKALTVPQLRKKLKELEKEEIGDLLLQLYKEKN